MMSRILERGEVKQRLRQFRPLYDKVFGARPKLEPAIPDLVRGYGGRAIFLLSFGRSGTTVFADFVATHPQIITRGEILNEDAFHNYLRWSRRVSQSWRPSSREHGLYKYIAAQLRSAGQAKVLFDMKIESLHLSEGNWREPGKQFAIFDYLLKSDCPVILLRRDGVARFLSHEIAVERNVFHAFQSGSEKDAKVTIDIDRMDANCRAVADQYRIIEEIFAAHPQFLALDYEALFASDSLGQRTFSPEMSERLAQLLGLDDAFDRSPAFDRVTGKGSMRFIANPEEVEAYRNGR